MEEYATQAVVRGGTMRGMQTIPPPMIDKEPDCCQHAVQMTADVNNRTLVALSALLASLEGPCPTSAGCDKAPMPQCLLVGVNENLLSSRAIYGQVTRIQELLTGIRSTKAEIR